MKFAVSFLWKFLAHRLFQIRSAVRRKEKKFAITATKWLHLTRNQHNKRCCSKWKVLRWDFQVETKRPFICWASHKMNMETKLCRNIYDPVYWIFPLLVAVELFLCKRGYCQWSELGIQSSKIVENKWYMMQKAICVNGPSFTISQLWSRTLSSFRKDAIQVCSVPWLILPAVSQGKHPSVVFEMPTVQKASESQSLLWEECMVAGKIWKKRPEVWVCDLSESRSLSECAVRDSTSLIYIDSFNHRAINS